MKKFLSCLLTLLVVCSLLLAFPSAASASTIDVSFGSVKLFYSNKLSQLAVCLNEMAGHSALTPSASASVYSVEHGDTQTATPEYSLLDDYYVFDDVSLTDGSYILTIAAGSFEVDSKVVNEPLVIPFTAICEDFDEDTVYSVHVRENVSPDLAIKTSAGKVNCFIYAGEFYLDFLDVLSVEACEVTFVSENGEETYDALGDMNTLFFDKNVVHFSETHNMDKGNYTIVIEPYNMMYVDFEDEQQTVGDKLEIPIVIEDYYGGFYAERAHIGKPFFPFTRGRGTEDDPYIIMSGTEFAAFRKYVVSENGAENMYFALGCDITIDDIEPFGETERKKGFCGVFDGRGHTVTFDNVVTEDDGASMFMMISHTGVVKNVVTAGTLESKGYYAAPVAVINDGIVANCINYADVTGSELVGGICTSAYSASENGVTYFGVIANCVNYGKITVSAESEMSSAGGIVGLAFDGGMVVSCCGYGAAESDSEQGNLGAIAGCLISNSWCSVVFGCVFDGTVCSEATGASIGTLLPEINEIQREETKVLKSKGYEYAEYLNDLIDFLKEEGIAEGVPFAEWIFTEGEYPTIDLVPAENYVLSLGGKVNKTTFSLRLGASYDASSLDKEARKTVTDIGIVFYPAHLLGEDSLDLENEHAVSISACAIDEGYDPAKKFVDYDSFTFYVTIVNIPEKGRDVDISFRSFIVFNEETVCYDGTMSRSYNGVLALNK